MKLVCQPGALLSAFRPFPLPLVVQVELQTSTVRIIHLQASLFFFLHHPGSIYCSIPADQLLFRKRNHSSFFQVRRKSDGGCSPLPDQLLFVACRIDNHVDGLALLAFVSEQLCQILRQSFHPFGILLESIQEHGGLFAVVGCCWTIQGGEGVTGGP